MAVVDRPPTKGADHVPAELVDAKVPDRMGQLKKDQETDPASPQPEFEVMLAGQAFYPEAPEEPAYLQKGERQELRRNVEALQAAFADKAWRPPLQAPRQAPSPERPVT